MVLIPAAFALAAGLAGGDCRTPVLVARIPPGPAKQGALFAVTLESDVSLAHAVAAWGGHDTAMERDGGGRVFRALLGIDFESPTGARTIEFDVEGLCGDRHSASRVARVVSGKFPIQKLKVAPEYVEPPVSELDRIREDHEKVGRVWASGDPERRWTGPFRLPVDAPPRDNFGSRRVLNGTPKSSHEGMDLAAAAGQPVTAPGPARVALADNLYFSGGTVILDHGAGLFTLYFHLSRIDVTADQVVGGGQLLGAVGATGRATGPHLHWGARVNRARVNPLDLLQLPSWPRQPSEKSLTGQSP
ncbi:MAG TPA: M23 family metallopeptidase [Thermoanaerobaculia bacterium]|jgi:murein DD-endopeptidase MepM/ murein hydrolase activator NlpD|nr:M23 family metallopeptidase [Thermoanaerobaculia bacterium]